MISKADPSVPLLFCEVERAELGPSLQAEFAMGVRKGREEREGKASCREAGVARGQAMVISKHSRP